MRLIASFSIMVTVMEVGANAWLLLYLPAGASAATATVPAPYAVEACGQEACDQESLPAGAWAVDPTLPGPNLPPAGRSLFDFLVTEKGDGKGVYHIPFPFEALMKKVEYRAGCGLQNAPAPSCLQAVLLPLGRSLQRTAAAPDFFKYPRAVVAVDRESTESGTRAGMLLKDRLYLGYQEKASVVEVISYNEAAGRFEFQVVKDYRAGGKPRVFYANRMICIACHQNHTPIFSRQVWDETNANPKIAALLQAQGRDFYGIAVNRGVDIPNAIDAATNRANLLPVYQRLWRDGCGGAMPAAVACRAALFRAALQYRLSGEQGFERDSPSYRDDFLPVFSSQWQRRWPVGLAIPNPDIPNRDPLPAIDSASALAHIPARFEPLIPRPPLETWEVTKPEDVERVVAGIAEFITVADRIRLDKLLVKKGSQARGSRRTVAYSSPCEFSVVDPRASKRRVGFVCNGVGDHTVRMVGRLELGTAEGERGFRGQLDHLALSDGGSLGDVALTGGTVERRGRQTVSRSRLVRNGRHARLPDGNVIERVTLRWRNPALADRSRFSGEAVITVLDDFAPVDAAIAEMSAQTRAGVLDVFSDLPFRRAAVLPALFARLGLRSQAWCCLDDAGMPVPHLDVGGLGHPARIGAAQGAGPALQGFYRYCAACHLTRETFPPNFLYGNARQVAANLSHCAERMFFRLSMWQLPVEDRPKTPMPPALRLQGMGHDLAKWPASAELTGLKQYAAGLLQAHTGSVPLLTDLMARNYESLRACLPGR